MINSEIENSALEHSVLETITDDLVNPVRWVQPVSATISFSLSAGVKYCNVFLGR